MPQNIFFDLDGTLTDPKDGITKSIIFALQKLGEQAPSSDQLEWTIGPPLIHSFRKLLGDESKAQAAVIHYRQRYSKIGLFENAIYPGIKDALEALQNAGKVLYVATSKPVDFANDIISHFGMRPYFTRIYGSELDGTRCDKGDLIQYILQKENISSENCIMIGDREHDAIGAAKNNIRALGVSWGYGTSEELTLAGTECILKKPVELYPYFFRNSR